MYEADKYKIFNTRFFCECFRSGISNKKTFADTKDLIGVEVQFSKPLVLEPATLESVTRSYSQKMAKSTGPIKIHSHRQVSQRD